MAQLLESVGVEKRGIGSSVGFVLVVFVPISEELLELMADMLLDDAGCLPDGRSLFDPEPSQLDFEYDDIELLAPARLRSTADRLPSSVWPV